MYVPWFYPLLFLTVLMNLFIVFFNRDITPGAAKPCDVVRDCGKRRFTFPDASWLCCEGNDGFVISHILHPYILAMYTGWPGFAAFIVFYFEAYEAFTASTFHNFGFAPDDAANEETLPGALLGDAAINGMLAVLLAIATGMLTNWRGFLGHWRVMSRAAFIKYTFILLLFSALFALSPATIGSFRYGVLIILAVDFILLLVVMPWVIQPGDVPGFDLAASYARVKWLFLFTITTLTVFEVVPLFMINPWYQAWLPTYTMLFLYVFIYLADVYPQIKKTRRRLKLERAANLLEG